MFFSRLKTDLLLPVLPALLLAGCACGGPKEDAAWSSAQITETVSSAPEAGSVSAEDTVVESSPSEEDSSVPVFDPDALPEWSGEPFITVNEDCPFFTAEELAEAADLESGAQHIFFTELDGLGRAGTAAAVLSPEDLETAERSPLPDFRPSGWQTAKYDGIDGNYLYNRCHLLGYQLTGDNGDPRNLITGTRYLNTEGMLRFENRAANYLRRNGDARILYRVTPVFAGGDLVASGVLMEARSLEDTSLSYCVYCYNVQPGVTIDYATGMSSGPAFTGSGGEDPAGTGAEDGSSAEDGAPDENAASPEEEAAYIVNTNSMKFHLPGCSAVKDMAEHNKLRWNGSREELLEQGYVPCGICRP